MVGSGSGEDKLCIAKDLNIFAVAPFLGFTVPPYPYHCGAGVPAIPVQRDRRHQEIIRKYAEGVGGLKPQGEAKRNPGY
jgi:hypothetical protein